MSDYDAIVIGAGHNGLTAAAVMARGGMRVLCLEKNHFIGGHVLHHRVGPRLPLRVGRVDPVPHAQRDLRRPRFRRLPHLRARGAVGQHRAGGRAAILLYCDPERLLDHLGETLGLDAVMGMAEVAGWAEAPARAIGRFDVRKPPKSLDEMWACATNEKERQAIRTAMFGSVMDVVDRFLPDRDEARPGPEHAGLPGRQLHLPGPLLAGQRALPGLRPGLTGRRHHVQGPGGIGTMSDHLPALFEEHGGELRRHAKVVRIVAPDGRVEGVALGDGEVVTAPVVVSNLDPTATFTQLLDRDALPEAFARRVDAIDHRAAYFQIHFALNGLPEYTGPYEVLNEGDLRRNVTFFGTAEQMQLDFEGCVRGLVPDVALLQPGDPHPRRPRPGPAREARRQQLRLLLPDRATHAEQARLRDEMAERIVDKIATMAPELPRPDRAPVQLPGLHLRADVRVHRRRLHPWAPAAGVHGPVPARAPGLARQSRSRSTVSTCVAPVATAARGSPSSPATTAATPCSTAAGSLAVVADLALDEGQVHGHREGQAGEEAHHEEDPRDAEAPSASVDDRPQRQQHHVDDRVVLGRRVGGPVGEQHLGVVDVAGAGARAVDVADVEVPAEAERDDADDVVEASSRVRPAGSAPAKSRRLETKATAVLATPSIP